MQQADICIAGAGIVGLSLALELERRGANVVVLERDTPLAHASQAAAGMLAAHDPDNPTQLLPLSELSLALYPAYLARIENLSGQRVPFQTTQTYQSTETSLPLRLAPPLNLPPGLTPGRSAFTLLEEHSLDPRQLASALLAAVRATSIRLLDRTTLQSASMAGHQLLRIGTNSGFLEVPRLVHTLGAWSVDPRSFYDWTLHSRRLHSEQPDCRIHEYRAAGIAAGTPNLVSPRKGQMLAVRLPPSLPLDYVVRTPEVYIVPRTQGPNAGRAIIGATIEDDGFSTQTDPGSLSRLRRLAARLLPALADEAAAPILDQWAGLRPHTPDLLPLLGETEHYLHFVATGHFRNGILLAPATAHLLAQVLVGESPDVDLAAFSPNRFNLPWEKPHRTIFAHPS